LTDDPFIIDMSLGSLAWVIEPGALVSISVKSENNADFHMRTTPPDMTCIRIIIIAQRRRNDNRIECKFFRRA